MNWRVKLHIFWKLQELGSLSTSIKNFQGAKLKNKTVGGPDCTFSCSQIQTGREPSLPAQTSWNFQILAATVDEISPGQLELEEDIQRKAQVPALHREMAGALRNCR